MNLYGNMLNESYENRDFNFALRLRIRVKLPRSLLAMQKSIRYSFAVCIACGICTVAYKAMQRFGDRSLVNALAHFHAAHE